MPNLKWTKGFHFDHLPKAIREAAGYHPEKIEKPCSKDKLESSLREKTASFQSRFESGQNSRGTKGPSLLALGLQIQELSEQYAQLIPPRPPQISTSQISGKTSPALSGEHTEQASACRAPAAPKPARTTLVRSSPKPSPLLHEGLATLASDPAAGEALRKLLTKSPKSLKKEAALELLAVSHLPDFGFFADMIRNHPAQARMLFKLALPLFLTESNSADKLAASIHFSLSRLTPAEGAVFICELLSRPQKELTQIFLRAISALKPDHSAPLVCQLSCTVRLPNYKKLKDQLHPIFEKFGLPASASGSSAATGKTDLSDKAFLNLSLLRRTDMREGLLAGHLAESVLSEILLLASHTKPKPGSFWAPVVRFFKDLCCQEPLSEQALSCLVKYSETLVGGPLKSETLLALQAACSQVAFAKDPNPLLEILAELPARVSTMLWEHIEANLGSYSAEQLASFTLIFPSLLNKCSDADLMPLGRILADLMESSLGQERVANWAIEAALVAPKAFTFIFTQIDASSVPPLLSSLSRLLVAHPRKKALCSTFSKLLSCGFLEELASNHLEIFRQILAQNPALLRPFLRHKTIQNLVTRELKNDARLFEILCRQEAWWLIPLGAK